MSSVVKDVLTELRKILRSGDLHRIIGVTPEPSKKNIIGKILLFVVTHITVGALGVGVRSLWVKQQSVSGRFPGK